MCVLESPARGQPTGGSLLTAVLVHDWPLVRWTAVRLIQAVDPNNAAIRSRPSETDPLVQARIKRIR